ncbi:MAG: cystathionine beta-lyase [Candidatus Adiutrix intracellularis]|jgi:cystathionine beta-lyase|nr:MAG: cystathionine beta-lyase [Candidatus Adiutrix intracellularis]MDR2827443.1 pyridoxal phosphate-dependent aminotransferase [Candidatus Adiutrix intracellularis]
MHYNFDEIIDRSQNFSVKYDERWKKFGTQDVIPLWLADMDFKTAQPIINALITRAAQGIFGYVSKPASYLEAYSQWQSRRHGWDVSPDLMSFCPGVVPALAALIQQFSEPGDEIMIQTPGYPEFDEVIRAWGRKTLAVPLAEDRGRYTVDFGKMAETLKRRPSFFILCSPHNPVGRVWTSEELTEMLRFCLEAGVLLISDEIHSDLVFKGYRHIPTASLSPEAAEITITCLSTTKTFNLAGLQASTTVFPNYKYKERFDYWWRNMDIHRNNCFSLVAMEAALRHGEEWLTQLLSYLEGNLDFIRDYCAKNILQIKPNRPEGTYLVWLDCRALGLNDTKLSQFMVKKAGLGLNNGLAFGLGGEGFMRLNAACPRSLLAQALAQLKAAVAELPS